MLFIKLIDKLQLMVESTNGRINHQLHTLPLYQGKVDTLALYSGKVVMWYRVSTVALYYGNVAVLYRANVAALYQMKVQRPSAHIRSSGPIPPGASWKKLQAGSKLGASCVKLQQRCSYLTET